MDDDEIFEQVVLQKSPPRQKKLPEIEKSPPAKFSPVKSPPAKSSPASTTIKEVKEVQPNIKPSSTTSDEPFDEEKMLISPKKKKSRAASGSMTSPKESVVEKSPVYESTSNKPEAIKKSVNFETSAPKLNVENKSEHQQKKPQLPIEKPTPQQKQPEISTVKEPKVSEQKVNKPEKVVTAIEETKKKPAEIIKKSVNVETAAEKSKEVVPEKKQLPALSKTTTKEVVQKKVAETKVKPLQQEQPLSKKSNWRSGLREEEDKGEPEAVDEIVVSEPVIFDEKDKDEEEIATVVAAAAAEKECREPVTFRKLSRLGSSSNNETRKKRTWGDSKKTKSGLDAKAISSSELKDIVPNIAPVLEELKEEQVKKMETDEKSPTISSSADDQVNKTITDSTNETSIVLPKPIIEDPEDIKGKLAPISEKNKNKSCVVEIRNLVRPFTNIQLINLLKRTGAFDENTHFWIDKIKSHALVKYERPQEAEETVLALDGVKWPSSNQKKLIVTFSSEDHFERQSKEQVSLKQPLTLEAVDRPQVKRKTIEERLERPEEKRPRKDSDHRPTEEEKPKKEQKSLEVLFNKTKALPSIYWMPKS